MVFLLVYTSSVLKHSLHDFFNQLKSFHNITHKMFIEVENPEKELETLVISFQFENWR